MTTVHERIKTVLLVVLLCGAVFLAYSTWFYDNPMGDRALDSLLTGEMTASGEDYIQSMEALREMAPLRVTVKNSRGRIGAEHSTDDVRALYDSTRALMAEALSVQSGSWYTVDEAQWEGALARDGVMYDYQGLVRADAVTGWLWGGAGETGSVKGRYLMLAVGEEGETPVMMLKNPDAGTVYASKTQLKNETVASVLDGVAGDACAIAAEQNGTDYEKLVPETVIIQNAKMPFVISGYNATSYFTEEQEEAFLGCFGFNPYSVSEYTDPDGTRMYIGETAATVSVEKDGFVTYSDTDADTDSLIGIFVQSAGDFPDGAEIYETACVLVSRLVAQVGGEGVLYPMDFTYYAENDSWVADFGWSVNGIPVDRHGTGYAARVVIRDRRVVEAAFYMRGYRSTDRTAGTISQKLAAAAVAQEDSPCTLELRYADAALQELEPAWYRKTK